MKKDLFDTLAKRMLFFTKVILTFLVIGALLFINFLDLQESNRNKVYLNLIRNVYEKKEADLRFQQFELERVAYLKKMAPHLWERHVEARTALVNLMNRYGARIDRATKGEEMSENRFVMMSTDEPMSNPESTHSATDFGAAVSVERPPDGPNEGTVEAAIEKFRRYGYPAKAYLITHIDTVLLKEKLDSIFSIREKTNGYPTTIPANQPLARSTDGSSGAIVEDVKLEYPFTGTGGNNGFANGLRFKSAHLVQNQLESDHLRPNRLLIRWTAPQSEQNFTNQGPVDRPNVDQVVPVTTDSATFPGTLQFAGYDARLIGEIIDNGHTLSDLSNLYGFYDVSSITSLSAEALKQNNEPVSILGFDVSRKWFPMAMFLVLAAVYAMLLETMKQASQLKHRIITEYASDDALEFLIDKRWIRFFLWVLTPPLLLFLVLYSTLIHYDVFFYLLLGLAGLSGFILGFLAFQKSLSL
ncbi:MAG: hypothetical protein H7Z75_19365 [Ferruginibacter sp.]|nr:hypothetical protein [Cytophagales bacterium]